MIIENIVGGVGGKRCQEKGNESMIYARIYFIDGYSDLVPVCMECFENLKGKFVEGLGHIVYAENYEPAFDDNVECGFCS